jgi:AcrR family transcriptional regulator
MGSRMPASARREQILDGAMQIFAQKGFRGTTTREIAQAIGISEALMFKYFPTKEALYRAIIQKQMNGTNEIFFPTEAARAKDDRQVFKAIASYLIGKNTDDPTFMRLILYSALEGHEFSRMFFEHYVLERTELLSQYIQTRMKENCYKKISPRLVARAFIGMVAHYVMDQEIYGMRDLFSSSQKKTVDTLVDIFLEGLKEKA